MAEEVCHCGRPLHYANADHRRQVEHFIEQLGPTVPVTVTGRTWLVPRHYIALHGLKAKELSTLGFPEVPSDAVPPGPDAGIVRLRGQKKPEDIS